MSVYPWCISCQARTNACSNAAEHKGANPSAHQSRADFLLGGRYGKRIRKVFPLKKDAITFEQVTMTDFKRGQIIPEIGDKAKTHFDVFLEKYKEAHVSPNMRGALKEISRLDKYKELWKGRPLNSIRMEEITDYLLKLLSGTADRKKPLEKTTVNREITVLKVLFNWAVDNNFLMASPMKKVKKYKTENIRVRWLNDDEIKKLLNACAIKQDLDLRDVCFVAMNTGFRLGNLGRLTSQDILGKRIQATKTKSGKPYDVPICSSLAETLRRLIADRPSGLLLNLTNIKMRWRRVMTHLGWTDVTLHTLRHTFAAQGLKRGVPLDRVCKWMGHYSSEFTRLHYGHLCPNQEAVEIELLNLGAGGANGSSRPSLAVLSTLREGDSAQGV